MRTIELEPNEVRQSVREHYSKVATRGSGCGCAATCCSPFEQGDARTLAEASQMLGYSASDTDAVPEGSNLGLGCGNPVAIASLRPGETVLDLGSGAGFDAFLASKAVGPTGSVIGVDMTPEMVAKARQNKVKGNYSNVDFRLGEIENLPVADASVDIIISNCVINLSPDKPQVFREAFRVLKPGGRVAISDILTTRPLPNDVGQDLQLYAGCVAGASLIDDVKRFISEAGFARVIITPKTGNGDGISEWLPGRRIENYIVSATIEAVKART